MKSRSKSYNFESELWIFKSEKSDWHVVTLPTPISREIRFSTLEQAHGWVSVRANAKLGKSEWQNALYLNAKSGRYLLPVAESVRKAEKAEIGDTLSITIEILID